MRVIGIDPGLDGGIALWDGKVLTSHVMPTLGSTSREIDIPKLHRILSSCEVTSAYLEKVSARPGQGVCSMFTFGMGYGVVLGVLSASAIPYNCITPQTWQKAMFGLGKKDTKAAAAIRASQVFPTHDFRATDRSRKPHSGMVDAALIAYFGRLRMLGRWEETAL